ncbi:TetR/AcrR family transcriptional regulator [Pseudomonas sp. 5P_3.1_Bac2]|uniref:TetR/AcrR family transcriptional regulator n=1 Tax=Pseudomonas sp. 5P_3.1_Bac2 TaxID=2971617 RepID=UPI0021C75B78|nr:TetR/AcrR family transcriptional regulator [Pseudomonas sp. 5P_3.1_Bac2]MCU1719033.1 TetR/AcrR family transcriptional regulator [Pseudomonas sp. 5P_3.1_Bac2]
MTAKKPSSFERNRELALQLFASQGFGQVSLRKLASSLGLSTAALYNHCSSKEELLYEALEEHYENILLIVRRSARSTSNAQQRLHSISRDIAQLHGLAPWRFLLANRERHCLSSDHRQQVEQLRQHIALQLLQLSAPPMDEQSPGAQVASQLALNLLEQLPVWLADSQLNAAGQRPLIEHFIQGALCQLSGLPRTPDIAEEPAYAELQRRSA